jgi:hypothetical protein
MTNGTQKKGLHPLVWVGIGCGVLLVLAAIGMLVVSLFVAKKVKDVAEDFEANPGMAAARTIVRLNPDLEEVDSDEDAGTITVRVKSTGEEVTVDFEDIQEGRISFTSDEGEMTIDAGEGGVTVTEEDGDQVFNLQTGDRWQGEVPDWVPVYPGAERGGGYEMDRPDGYSAGFQLTTADGADKVLEFYRSTLEAEGFAVSSNVYSADAARGGLITGEHEETGRTLQVVVGQEGDTTTAALNFSIKK